jgi:hypothetical protein
MQAREIKAAAQTYSVCLGIRRAVESNCGLACIREAASTVEGKEIMEDLRERPVWRLFSTRRYPVAAQS